LGLIGLVALLFGADHGMWSGLINALFVVAFSGSDVG